MRLKELREEKELTQADVVAKGKELGGKFTQQQLSRWENGSLAPSNKNIEILAKIFDVKKDELFDDRSENSSINFYNDGFEYGKTLAENGLKFEQFTTCQKKHGVPDFSNKTFEEAKDAMIELFIDLSVGVSAPISKKFLEVINKNDIYLFYMGLYNGVLSGSGDYKDD